MNGKRYRELMLREDPPWWYRWRRKALARFGYWSPSLEMAVNMERGFREGLSWLDDYTPIQGSVVIPDSVIRGINDELEKDGAKWYIKT